MSKQTLLILYGLSYIGAICSAVVAIQAESVWERVGWAAMGLFNLYAMSHWHESMKGK